MTDHALVFLKHSICSERGVLLLLHKKDFGITKSGGGGKRAIVHAKPSFSMGIITESNVVRSARSYLNVQCVQRHMARSTTDEEKSESGALS